MLNKLNRLGRSFNRQINTRVKRSIFHFENILTMKPIMNWIGVLLFFVQVTNGLHFYLNTGQTRCFFEELPRDTLVVAKVEALEYSEHGNDYFSNNNLRLEFTVDVCIRDSPKRCK